jgi:hypothetical protein
MSNEEIIKIVMVTAITVVLKDVFSWALNSTKPLARTLAKIIGTWMVSHFNALDFALDAFFLIFWIYLLFILPDGDTTATVSTVRGYFLYALIVIAQAYHTKKSFLKWTKPKNA